MQWGYYVRAGNVDLHSDFARGRPKYGDTYHMASAIQAAN
jgi:hypothetical protein